MSASLLATKVRAVLDQAGWDPHLTPADVIARWQRFVDLCAVGYPRDLHDYSIDIRVREAIHAILSDPALEGDPAMPAFAHHVAVIDQQFRGLLLPGVTIPHQAYWWEKGVPRIAGEDLANDLHIIYGIHVPVAASLVQHEIQITNEDTRAPVSTPAEPIHSPTQGEFGEVGAYLTPTQARGLDRFLPALSIGVSLFALAALLLIAIVQLATMTFSSSLQFTTYDFSLISPRGWVLTDLTADSKGNDPEIVVLLQFPKVPPPGPTGAIYRSAAKYDTLTQVFEWAEQKSETLPGYEAVSLSPLWINAEHTVLREFIFQPPQEPPISIPRRRCLADYRQHNRTGYILLLCLDVDSVFDIRQFSSDLFDGFSYR
jgi:hypothetical protein